MKKRVVEVKDIVGRDTLVTTEETNIYCVNCGGRNVYHIIEHDDFHAGVCYLCIDCEHQYFVQSIERLGEGWNDREIIGVLNKIKEFLSI